MTSTKLTLAVLIPLILSGCATTRTAPTSADPAQDAPPVAAKADAEPLQSEVEPAATQPSEAPSDAKVNFTTGVVEVDVTVGPVVVSRGLGYWVDHGVVLTALRTVNNVPPNGGLVVRAGGSSFNASTWVAGNYTDLDAALLYVHERPKQGALPDLIPVCADGVESTPEDRLLTPDGEVAIPDRMDQALTGATVYSTSAECRLGVLSADPEDLAKPRITPIAAQAILEKSLPKD